jgi:hypothetical protein
MPSEARKMEDLERLSPEQKRRYARQVLLAEIGEAGQLRLCRTRVRIGAASDPRAAAIATDYLLRAGMVVTTEDAAPELVLGAAGAIDTLSGDSGFGHAAAALAGAFSAVEAIKAALGAGTPANLPTDLVLAGRSTPESTSRAR